MEDARNTLQSMNWAALDATIHAEINEKIVRSATSVSNIYIYIFVPPVALELNVPPTLKLMILGKDMNTVFLRTHTLCTSST